jgi:hypothetical protein
MDYNTEDEEAKVQNTEFQTEAALGATFEILFRKKLLDVLYLFLQPCQHPACWDCCSSNKNQGSNRGFLQLGTSTALTALDKLLCSPVSAFLSGEWERCDGGLFGNKEYETCRAANSPWMPIQTKGEFGNSNKGRVANKSPQNAVIASWDVLSLVSHLN